MIRNLLKKVYHSKFLNTPRMLFPMILVKLIINVFDFLNPFRFSQIRAILLRLSGVNIDQGSKICGGGICERL